MSPPLEPATGGSGTEKALRQPSLRTAWNIGAAPVPLVTTNEWWGKLDEAFDSLAAAFAKDPKFHLAKTLDQMDDHVTITLAIQASIVECADLRTPPIFMFRIHRNSLSLKTETFIFVKEKFFFRKGKNVRLRLRFDDEAPLDFKCFGSTNFSSVFLAADEMAPLLKLATTDRLRVQITREHGSPLFAIFDIYSARPPFDFFFKGLLGPEFMAICCSNPQIVAFVLLLGPKNILLKKRALAELGFYHGPIDTTKPGALFQAIERYAEARRASEVFSMLEPGKMAVNMPWHIILYNEASAAVRSEMGPLKIFD